MMNVPMIRLNDLPQNEREDAHHVQGNLYRMDRTVNELKHTVALSLMGYGQAQVEGKTLREAAYNIEARSKHVDIIQMFSTWGSIGGRHGALIIHGFMRTKTITDGLINKIPAISSKIDRSFQKKSNSLFVECFPKISTMRLNVAHPGEFGTTKEKFHEDAIKGPAEKGSIYKVESEGAVLFDGTLMGSEYCSTIGGELVCYEVSEKTADNLRAIADLYFEAFRPLSAR